MKRILTAAAALLLLCCLLASCGAPQADDGRVQVVATLFPQYDFAKNIAGDRADVTLLLDFGADAHTYDPTPADILQIARADLFIYTGDGMELWAKKLLASADIAAAVERGSLRVLDLSESVPLLPADHTGAEEEHEHADHDHDEADPHIWTSFANAKAMCAAIADALTATDADGATVYAANLAAYTAKLDALDAQMQEVRDAAVRDTVCFGGSFAFVYLFDEYNLAHRGVPGGDAGAGERRARDRHARRALRQPLRGEDRRRYRRRDRDKGAAPARHPQYHKGRVRRGRGLSLADGEKY